MERFTFIKTNEKNDEDLDTEDERVEMEVVIDFEDMDKLSEKFQNFLSGCGYNKVVEINVDNKSSIIFLSKFSFIVF